MVDRSRSEFEEAMKIIKARGFVSDNRVNSNALYRYDFNTCRFEPYDKNRLYNLFNKVYLNSYDVIYSIGTIINELPKLDFTQVNNFYKYNDIKDNNLDIKKLEKDLKPYLDENQENKKSFNPIQWKLQSQLQHLINNDVFTDGNLLCKYNPAESKLTYIAPKDLIKLFRNVKNKEYLSQYGLQGNYFFFVNNLTNIGNLYDDFKEYHKKQLILDKYENDYNTIQNIIDGFN